MEQKNKNYIIMIVIFVAVIVFGGIYMNSSQYGYTESCLLYIAGVIAAGLFWIGRER